MVANGSPKLFASEWRIEMQDSERRERIDDGIGDCGRRCGSGGFPDPLDAERIVERPRGLDVRCDIWQVSGPVATRNR
jgi:hypothetical protein